MSVSEAFREQIRELLADFGSVRFKPMFGAAGVYAGDLIFGLADDDVLWLKTDEASQPAFREAGSQPFIYYRDGKPMPMSYWRLPDAALDDPDEAVRWARMALEAAHRSAAGKKPKKRKG